jgi:tRNA(Leu) C34 or U34 (ribose-2'-O)-methylase TrmL
MNCCENCDSEKAQYTTKDSKFFFCNEQCQKTYFQKNLTQGCPFMFGKQRLAATPHHFTNVSFCIL